MSLSDSAALEAPEGFTAIRLDEAGSTNDEAKVRAEAGAADGTAVWARCQRAGRGRRGRRWVSPPGNLYVSVVLRPACAARRAAQLSFVAALAAADLVDRYVPGRARCKWPNDILVEGRKIAGILLESAAGPGGHVDWVVAGIGVNLARHPGLGPPLPSTSLTDLGTVPPSPEEALPPLLAALARRRAAWAAGGFAPVRAAWLARAHGLGAPVTVSAGDRRQCGIFEGLDAEGALVLREQSGARQSVAAGEAVFGEAGTAHAACH